MATLQKFKLLATQCAAVSGSPTRSPNTSPVVRLRRRKSLRMLLSRSGGDFRGLPERASPERRTIFAHRPLPEKNQELLRRTLKDLFVSPPPPPPLQEDDLKVKGRLRGENGSVFPSVGPGIGPGSPRPVTMGFRHRLGLRRAWRPTLGAIAE